MNKTQFEKYRLVLILSFLIWFLILGTRLGTAKELFLDTMEVGCRKTAILRPFDYPGLWL